MARPGRAGYRASAMDEPAERPGRDIKPEDEDAYRLADAWLSEPVILGTGFAIFLLCIVIFEWSSILDAIVALFPK